MPSASANISAKFIAQIEMRRLRDEEQRAGGGDKAEDRQHQRQAGGDQRPEREHEDPSVTGQEISSDFIIAVRFALLKSDHMPDAPVRRPARRSCRARSSAP